MCTFIFFLNQYSLHTHLGSCWESWRHRRLLNLFQRISHWPSHLISNTAEAGRAGIAWCAPAWLASRSRLWVCSFLPASVAAPLCWLLFTFPPCNGGVTQDSAFGRLLSSILISLVASFMPLTLNTMFMQTTLKCIFLALFYLFS